jgi:hypothetical protein
MIKTLSVLLLSAATFTAYAQNVDNGGLEKWTISGNQVPDSFYTSDMLLDAGTVTRSTDAHSGSYSALLETKVEALSGLTMPGTMSYSGTAGLLPVKWPFNARPDALRFWYKFARQGNDSAFVSINLSKWNGGSVGTPVGIASWKSNTNAPNWTMVQLPITYAQTYNPDSIMIVFQNANLSLNMGTKLWVDDISLVYSTDVEDVAKNKHVFIFPNPAEKSFVVNCPEEASVNVFDIMGRRVYGCNNFKKENGAIDCSNWSAGVYTVEIKIASNIYIEKLRID